jgi:CBS domain-containing membrane protein
MHKRVADLMTRSVFAVGPEDDLALVSFLMSDHDVRHVPVVDEEKNLVGLVSQRDVLRNTLLEGGESSRVVREEALEAVRVVDVMSDPEAVEEETFLADAAELMLENKFGCLPVVQGDRLVGILTESDFVRAAVAQR